MNWLNLQTSTLRAPEYIGSEPVARATWLNVLAYCCEQENGGRIVGGNLWKDRQWQQTCGVTLGEVVGARVLITVDGNDIVVWNYPVDKEAEVASKRRVGKLGGEASGKARREAKTNQPGSKNEPLVQPKSKLVEAESKQNRSKNEPPAEPVVEGKGMEGNGREEKGTRDAALAESPAPPPEQPVASDTRIPSLHDFCEFYKSQIPDLGPPAPVGDWLMQEHGWHSANDWHDRPPKNWKALLGKLIADYRHRHAQLKAQGGATIAKASDIPPSNVEPAGWPDFCIAKAGEHRSYANASPSVKQMFAEWLKEKA